MLSNRLMTTNFVVICVTSKTSALAEKRGEQYSVRYLNTKSREQIFLYT